MQITDVLHSKSGEVITIHQDQTVYEAIRILVEKNIGAVMVQNEKEEIVGLLSERDILRVGYRQCEKLREIPVKEVMTADLIIAEPQDDIGYAEQMMIENNIRHLPVFSDGILAGIISMRDVMQAELRGAKFENRYLKDYIAGKYPA